MISFSWPILIKQLYQIVDEGLIIRFYCFKQTNGYMLKLLIKSQEINNKSIYIIHKSKLVVEMQLANFVKTWSFFCFLHKVKWYFLKYCFLEGKITQNVKPNVWTKHLSQTIKVIDYVQSRGKNLAKHTFVAHHSF